MEKNIKSQKRKLETTEDMTDATKASINAGILELEASKADLELKIANYTHTAHTVKSNMGTHTVTMETH